MLNNGQRKFAAIWGLLHWAGARRLEVMKGDEALEPAQPVGEAVRGVAMETGQRRFRSALESDTTPYPVPTPSRLPKA